MHRTVNWILMLALIVGTFALYAIKDGTRRMEARVQAQERVLERLESDVSVLGAERAHLARPERLEPLARKLGMAPVSGNQYLRVDAQPTFPSHLPAGVPSPLVGEGQGGGDRRTSTVGAPPTPSPSPQGGGESARRSWRAPPSSGR
jgi:cell division protein FtsL